MINRCCCHNCYNFGVREDPVLHLPQGPTSLPLTPLPAQTQKCAYITMATTGHFLESSLALDKQHFMILYQSPVCVFLFCFFSDSIHSWLNFLGPFSAMWGHWDIDTVPWSQGLWPQGRSTVGRDRTGMLCFLMCDWQRRLLAVLLVKINFYLLALSFMVYVAYWVTNGELSQAESRYVNSERCRGTERCRKC